MPLNFTKDDMATKPKSTAVAVKKSTAVVDIQTMLKASREALDGRTASGTGNQIKTNGKMLTLPDGRKTPAADFVIVDFVSRNEFYDRDYDRDTIVPSACFAIGTVIKDLTPSDNSPVKQADTCKECPMNEFGSKGKGKACSNCYLLAVLPPDADTDTPIYTIKVSPTGRKSFDSFIAGIKAMQSSPVENVVNVSFNDGVDYPQLVFGEVLPNDNVGAHIIRMAEAKAILKQEPDVSSYAPAAPVKTPARRAPAVARR